MKDTHSHSQSNVRCLQNVSQYAHLSQERILLVAFDAVKVFNEVDV